MPMTTCEITDRSAPFMAAVSEAVWENYVTSMPYNAGKLHMMRAQPWFLLGLLRPAQDALLHVLVEDLLLVVAPHLRAQRVHHWSVFWGWQLYTTSKKNTDDAPGLQLHTEAGCCSCREAGWRSCKHKDGCRSQKKHTHVFWSSTPSLVPGFLRDARNWRPCELP